jgi:hypothetical protein
VIKPIAGVVNAVMAEPEEILGWAQVAAEANRRSPVNRPARDRDAIVRHYQYLSQAEENLTYAESLTMRMIVTSM